MKEIIISDIRKILDFNEIDKMSMTNIHVQRDSNLAMVQWRNSMFQHYIFVRNSAGILPAVSERLPVHCFTRTGRRLKTHTINNIYLYGKNKGQEVGLKIVRKTLYLLL